MTRPTDAALEAMAQHFDMREGWLGTGRDAETAAMLRACKREASMYARYDAKLAEAEAALAGYREMEAESNAQGGPSVIRLQMEARRDRINAEKSIAERDAALGVLQEAHGVMESGCDADAWAILRDAIAARQKGGEG